jgi:hypothetical protein
MFPDGCDENIKWGFKTREQRNKEEEEKVWES